MSETKHTPGRWIATDYDVYSDDKTVEHDVICVSPSRRQDLQGQWEANARLIAAAPTMRELLVKALPIIEAEADMRGECSDSTGYTPLYHTEMRELTDEIEALLRTL